MSNDNEEVEYVEAEIVDYVPGPGAPAVTDVPYEALPPKSISAPRPEELWRGGYFQKGGLPGPGAKRMYPTPEDLKEAIDRYFAARMVSALNPQTGIVEYRWTEAPTVPGLALALHLSTNGFKKYGTREEYAEIVQWAITVIESYFVGVCATQGQNGGPIFILKNLGYSDTQTVQFAPPNRLEAAKTVEQIAEIIDADVVVD